MPNVIIVERLGSLKSTQMKTTNEEEFYKKAGFKTATDFQVHHAFKLKVGDADPYNIVLYGKTVGKANQENKYDFPPPVDHTLFFGNCLLVNKNDQGEVLDLSVELWEKMYEKLFGGFEDLTRDDSSEDEIDEEEQRILNDPNTQFTKEGYVKDDFIVDDDSDELLDESEDMDDSDEDELDDDDSEVDVRPPTKKPTKNAKTCVSPNSVKSKSKTVPKSKASPVQVESAKDTAVSLPKPCKVRTTTSKDKKPAKTAGTTKSKRTAWNSEESPSDAPSALICQDELTEEEYFT
jgi:hypothetical protein